MKPELVRERASAAAAPAHRARSAAGARCRIRSWCSATTTACSMPIPPRRPSSRSARACSSARRCPTSSPSPARLAPWSARSGARARPSTNTASTSTCRAAACTASSTCSPAAFPNSPSLIVLMLQQRSMAQMIERQLTHRAAARSVSGMAAVLAHEIKNPLSGIRGAAQLLEPGLKDEDRALTQLICTETDRIRTLVDRMEVFGDERTLVSRARQHSFGARPRKTPGRERLHGRHHDQRRLRPLAAARTGQPRQAHPGLPQSGEERRRGDRRAARARPHRAAHRLPPGHAPVGARHRRARQPAPDDRGGGHRPRRPRNAQAAPVRSRS